MQLVAGGRVLADADGIVDVPANYVAELLRAGYAHAEAAVTSPAKV